MEEFVGRNIRWVAPGSVTVVVMGLAIADQPVDPVRLLLVGLYGLGAFAISWVSLWITLRSS